MTLKRHFTPTPRDIFILTHLLALHTDQLVEHFIRGRDDF
jgi:hypothetical protein